MIFRLGLLTPLLWTLACSDPSPRVTGVTGSGNHLTPESLFVWRDTLLASNARPVFDANAVYGLANHVAYAVDRNTGVRLWSTPFSYPANVPMLDGFGTALAAGRVIIGDIDVFGLDPATGAIIWRFPPRLTFPGERSFDRLTTDGSRVYVGGVWGNVYGVDAATGTQQWVTHITTLADSQVRVFNPIVAGGVVYAAFSDRVKDSPVNATVGGVAAIDAASGSLLWSTVFPFHFGLYTNETHSVGITATRVVAGTGDGFFYGLDPKTGAILDTVPQTVFGVPAGTSLLGWSSVATRDTLVVIGASNGTTVALDARNLQRKLWTAAFSDGGVADLSVDSARVYVTYFGGQLDVFDLATGKLVVNMTNYGFRSLEMLLAAPASDGKRIYVGTFEGMYAFKWY